MKRFIAGPASNCLDYHLMSYPVKNHHGYGQNTNLIYHQAMAAMQMMNGAQPVLPGFYSQTFPQYGQYGDVPQQATNPIPSFCDEVDPSKLPSQSQITRIHIYDFDATLFKTPLPNPDLLSTSAISILESLNGLHGGGWWADSRFLFGTGEGYEKERSRAWEGWWDEKVVELARLSQKDPETLSIVLTGRRAEEFKHLIRTMLDAKELKFDAVILRKDLNGGESTLQYKSTVISEIVKYYKMATEVTIYEDKAKQAAGFRKSLRHLRTRYHRANLVYDVVEVYDPQKYLDPLVELALIENAIEDHNNAAASGTLSPNTRYSHVSLGKEVTCSGYLLDRLSYKRVLDVVLNHELITKKAGSPPNSVKFEADCAGVFSSKGPLSPQLEPLRGAKVDWLVTHVGQLENRIWAAKVAPQEGQSVEVEPGKDLVIIVAIRRKVNPTAVAQITEWHPIEPLTVHSVVGERSLLRINTVLRRD